MHHKEYIRLSHEQQRVIRMLSRRTKPTALRGHQIRTAKVLADKGYITVMAIKRDQDCKTVVMWVR